MATPLWIADISHWNAGINVGQVVQAGCVAVMCKATEGMTFRDNNFDGYIAQARKAGAIPGGYHYLRSSDGAAQARHFHKRIAQQGGPAGWLIMLDAEADGYGPQMTAWAREWNRLTNSHPFFIYSGAWWWPRTKGFRGADLTPLLWHSHYVDDSDTIANAYSHVPTSWWNVGYGGWRAATMLQFTSRAQVAGRRIDISAYRGTLDELRSFTRPSHGGGGAADWTEGIIMALPTLRKGDRGEHVKTLQGLLIARGSAVVVDGQFGPATEQAVRREQAQAHITADGTVGRQTWTALLTGKNG